MMESDSNRQVILAICYDFDKTLTPTDMQAQGYIQSIGYDIENFWEETNALAKQNDMDSNLAYMLKMVQESEGTLVFNRKMLEDYGARVKLFPGVETWFDRIGSYGASRKVKIEHYIISSGLKEMIEGTSIARRGVFQKIYASSFYYNERGVAIWPSQVVNFTGKTQYLFRISKGVLDVNDLRVNEYFPADKLRIPFRNMVYIGDSDTDIPCMKLINSMGGHSIGVYDPVTNDKSKVQTMLKCNRVRYIAKADYSESSELESLIHKIIDKTVTFERLETQHTLSQIDAELI